MRSERSLCIRHGLRPKFSSCTSPYDAWLIWFSAAMGGLLGLGLGMSFISVIELVYFFIVRRFFLQHRIPSDQTLKSSHSPNSDEVRKVWPSSQTLSSVMTTMEPNVDGQRGLQLVRRGSLNLPAHMQARLYKYWWLSVSGWKKSTIVVHWKNNNLLPLEPKANGFVGKCHND